VDRLHLLADLRDVTAMHISDYSTPMPDYFQSTEEGPDFYDLDFDYKRPPLTANQRLHWREKADRTSGVRAASRYLARRIPELGRCEVSLTWYVTDRRRRDADNVVPTFKAMCDGLIDAGIVVDDTPEFMTKHMPAIVPGPRAHMVLRVARIVPEAVAS
jgi:hypothetical protein